MNPSSRLFTPIISLSTVLLLALTLTARATTTEITLLPSYVGAAGSVSGVQGNFAPGFDSGSWSYNMGGPDNKAEVYIDPSALFSGTVHVGDIASISYWTNTTVQPGVDWANYIYTAPTGNQDTGSFYHSRLISEPIYTNSATTPNTWVQWSSTGATGTNALRVYDTARDGGVLGTPTDPLLSSAFNGPITFANMTTHDYTGETVKYFSLQTGSAWSAGFTGLLDGLTITLKDGDVGIVNFEAVPEASTWVSGALMVITLGAFAFRRRKATA